jgi:hypothetical protein
MFSSNPKFRRALLFVTGRGVGAVFSNFFFWTLSYSYLIFDTFSLPLQLLSRKKMKVTVKLPLSYRYFYNFFIFLQIYLLVLYLHLWISLLSLHNHTIHWNACSVHIFVTFKLTMVDLCPLGKWFLQTIESSQQLLK